MGQHDQRSARLLMLCNIIDRRIAESMSLERACRRLLRDILLVRIFINSRTRLVISHES